MTEKEMRLWLINWFNLHGAGSARNQLMDLPFRGATAVSDTTLILMAFDLDKLARDLVEESKKR